MQASAEIFKPKKNPVFFPMHREEKGKNRPVDAAAHGLCDVRQKRKSFIGMDNRKQIQQIRACVVPSLSGGNNQTVLPSPSLCPEKEKNRVFYFRLFSETCTHKFRVG